MDDRLVTAFLSDIDQSDICEYVTLDFMKRLQAFDMVSASECTMREFIGPILVSAVVKMQDSDMKICPERNIEGKMGKGPVDYVITFLSFYICVVEAKKDDFEGGVVQNIAQIKASREMFMREDTRKRNCNVWKALEIFEILFGRRRRRRRGTLGAEDVP
jgi:hypothetical protein